MHIILNNIWWMSWNIFLASIPVYFGWKMLQTKDKLKKTIFSTVWLLFLPNTIYLLTDIIHFFADWKYIPVNFLWLFTLQYVLLFIVGIVSFVVALHPLEKLLKRTKKRYNPLFLIYVFNFVIAFGVVLGRIHRLNSWDVVTNIPLVVQAVMWTMMTAKSLLFVIIFGMLANVIYLLALPLLRRTH